MTTSGIILKDHLHRVVKEMKEKLYKSQAEMGVLTSIPELDNLIGGFQPLGLYIVGARPNVGKSALLFQFALSAIKRGTKVTVFSLEMTADEVIERMVVNEGQISSSYLTQGGERLMQREREAIETSLGKASNTLQKYWENLTIFDHGMDIEQLVSLTRQQEVDLVIVDYIGLVKPTGTHFGRHLEVGQVSHELKELAKELKIPVVAGAQVNRAPASSKKSDQRKPGLADLRESGSLEQDADVVLMLHRERDEDGCFASVGEALITVAKGRKVRHGVVKTTYIGEQFRFEPMTFLEPLKEPIQPHGPDGSLLK